MRTYELTYDSQGCYDDGYVTSHEVGWHFNQRTTITASTDAEAREKAREWIKERSGKHPCSSGCGNKGLYRLKGLHQIATPKRREVKL